MRRPTLLAAALLAGALTHAAAQDATKNRPNLIVILSDDQGRGDYSAFGTPDLRTPGIDRLMREGMEFTNFYANSPVCSPTRAALLTGRYPDRVGVPGVIRQDAADSWGYLSPTAELLPKALQRAGYHTALVGKWHLGYVAPNTPNDRGFHLFHGFLGDMMDDYLTHRRGGKNWMRLDRKEIDPPGHATDLFTQWATEYVRSRANKKKPFFLYLAYNAPHDPVQPKEEWVARVRQRQPGLDEKRVRLLALIEHMDDGIGQVLRTLDETGQRDNTLVVFTSDNGGVLANGANNGPWRSAKGHVYEGGIRVPGAVRWPGRVSAGSRTDRVTLTMDLFPTLLAAAGAPAPQGIEGRSALPTLEGKPETEPQGERYWVRREGGPGYGGKTIEAVRRGPWKILQDSPYGPRELYHLERDPRETENLATKEPVIFRQLSEALQRQVQEGGAVAWQRLCPKSPCLSASAQKVGRLPEKSGGRI